MYFSLRTKRVPLQSIDCYLNQYLHRLQPATYILPRNHYRACSGTSSSLKELHTLQKTEQFNEFGTAVLNVQ